MIKRIKRLIEEAHFARHTSEIELNVTESSYHNALLVEQLKEDTVNDAIKYMIDDLVKIKQTYPKDFTSVVSASVDVVVLEGKHFREIVKLLDGLHEIWVSKEPTKVEQTEG